MIYCIKENIIEGDTKMVKLSDKDYDILNYIYEQIKENGFPPTVREICAATGLNSTSTVHMRLRKLETTHRRMRTRPPSIMKSISRCLYTAR